MSEVENDGVETQADFAQLMEESGVMEWLTDSAPGEDVPHDAPADTGDAERPRDDKGRFLPTQAEEADATESVAEEGELPEPVNTDPQATADDDEIVIELDDDLAAVLERYDGDIGKALRSLQDKESFTGRQANEIGQLRAELAAMRQAIENQPQQQPQQYFGPYQNDLDENPKGLVAEALERGDQRTLELAIRAWGDEEPFEAAAFLFALQNQAQAPQAEQPTPSYEAGPSIEEAMAAVVQRHPDVEKHIPALGEVAKEFPTLRNFMESGTPAQQAQAFEELLVIAKTRSTDTSTAMKRVILRTQEEVRKEKADAQVVSAQTQSAATPEESRLEQFYKAFEEASGQVEDEHWIHRT